ncbi:hypothetical protein A5708_16645 [Mycobacterium colombiense]|uniref:Uncharacterized protein n=1 Tax=Mycobacterium colombiense TaxID=339268 RepID=A0A1A2Z6A7_9MYCO|nr:hypothetical protein A5708_16645 [Mycobacterium colombiense]
MVYPRARTLYTAFSRMRRERTANLRFSFSFKKESNRPQVSIAATQKYMGSRFLNSLSVPALMLRPVRSLYFATTRSMYRMASAGLEKQRMVKSQSAQIG